MEGIFGAEGLMLTSIFLIPQRMAMWSVGVSYFMQGAGAAPTTPEEKRAHRKAVILKTIRHPCIVAVVLGMVLLLTQCPLPTFLGNTIKSVSICNTGMSMILAPSSAAATSTSGTYWTATPSSTASSGWASFLCWYCWPAVWRV